ncbi:hypothetical protein LLQ54_22110 [Rouxiella badensis]|uniref:hypothetical protein n=1 Tax=Rouxiella badensis TaxID=1646377 RepID=UPI001D144023|nr:hypothetical protein [Rouxiella badensis]MCC3742567.1 hypothetical protein [Rouxiella badensis]
MTERLITCSHCRSKIPHGANVCSGCRAEIEYGTPNAMLLLALLTPGGLALTFVKYLHLQFDFSNTSLWTIWGVLTAAGFGVLAWGMAKLFKNRIEFTRQKNK